MVALSFQKEFRQPILDRVKRHTLRDRAGRFHEGCKLHLYTGMRTKYCRAIGTATCIGLLPIRIDFQYRRVEFTTSGHAITAPDDTDAFAVGDGFPEGWHQMRAFWIKHHPEVEAAWDGTMIQWGDTLVPHADA